MCKIFGKIESKHLYFSIASFLFCFKIFQKHFRVKLFSNDYHKLFSLISSLIFGGAIREQTFKIVFALKSIRASFCRRFLYFN